MTEDSTVLKKADLTIPELQKLEFEISPLPVFKDKNGKEIDFTGAIKAEDIDKKLTLKVGEFKTFYDSLVEGFKKYNESIDSTHTQVTESLSSIIDSIGSQTEELNSIIGQLKEDMPY